MPVHASPFDSRIYGCKIGRLVVAEAAELAPSLAEARAAGYAVVFLRIGEADAAIAAAVGTPPLETLVTSELTRAPIPAIRTTVAVEHLPVLTEAGDIRRVADLTAESITISHLHADPRLPRDRTRALYAEWATNDVTGRAQRTLVAREGGEITGYITVLIADGVAVIDLVAVSPALQGRGIGSALLHSFVGWVRGNGLAARVGTQANNPALGLYRRYGFAPTTRQSTYHLWLA